MIISISSCISALWYDVWVTCYVMVFGRKSSSQFDEFIAAPLPDMYLLSIPIAHE